MSPKVRYLTNIGGGVLLVAVASLLMLWYEDAESADESPVRPKYGNESMSRLVRESTEPVSGKKKKKSVEVPPDASTLRNLAEKGLAAAGFSGEIAHSVVLRRRISDGSYIADVSLGGGKMISGRLHKEKSDYRLDLDPGTLFVGNSL